MNDVNFEIVESRVRSNLKLRKQLFLELYQTTSNNPAGQNVTNQILNDLSQSFSRYAGNQQTAFDNGAPASSAGSDASQMQRQVERAISQVLGRAPGRGAESFIGALNGAFPVADGGQVNFTPSRSMVSLYNADEGSPGAGNSFAGQLSARQANLYRQSTIITADALKVLDGLQPFAPEAELDQVEALRKLVRTTLNALVEEFARVDEPRRDRVISYFTALQQHLNQFGRRSFLDKVTKRPATIVDEAMTAGYDLLKKYAGNLRSFWDTFDQGINSPNTFSLSQRIERAIIMLPIIAQANNEFEAALNSVGLQESERHSLALKFSHLNDSLTAGQAITQPDLTVFDLTDWLDRFSSLEGPVALADAGQYGLDFVTDQADSLTFVILPIVGLLRTTGPAIGSSSSRLAQIFSNERVIQSLDNILAQLNSLADLAAPGGTPI